jgi:hypothetical protein
MRQISLLAFAFSASVICSLSLTLGSARAGVIYATGFEPPSFTVGPINGQSGWFVFSASGQVNDPVIETTLVKSGLQAVSVDGSVTGQTGPVYSPNLVDPILTLSADIYLGSSSSDRNGSSQRPGRAGLVLPAASISRARRSSPYLATTRS